MKAETILPAPERPTSLRQMCEASAAEHADSIVVEAHGQSPDYLHRLVPGAPTGASPKWLQWSHAQLREAAYRVSAGLLDIGIERESNVAMFLPNRVECPLMFWVSVILQCTIIPLDPGFLEAGRGEMLSYYLDSLRPDTVLALGVEASERLDEAVQKLGLPCERRIVLEGSARPGWKLFSEVASDEALERLEGDARLAQQDELDDNGKRVGFYVFTSGTSTGKPKGCPAMVRSIIHMSVTRGGIQHLPRSIIVTGLYFRAIAINFTFNAITTGRRLILMRMPFTPAHFLAAIEESGGETALLVPAFIHSLAADKTVATRKTSALSRLNLGGDIATVALIREAQELFPNTIVACAYGMSEGVGAVGFQQHEKAKGVTTHNNFALLGSVLPGTGLRICDPEGHVLQRGETGEVHLSGLSMIDHYLNNASPESFYTDDLGSWFRTGDTGVMLEDGQLCVMGRIKDVIKRKAVALSPAVIELALTKLGFESAVVGLPHTTYGEVPIAIVRDHAGAPLDVAAIKRSVLDALGEDSSVDEVVPLSRLGYSEFPLNQTGKVQKLELRELLMSKHE